MWTPSESSSPAFRTVDLQRWRMAAHAAPGVRALIIFSGGLRQDACTDWQGNQTRAIGAYGEGSTVPSLWLYGENDSIWPATLSKKMHAAYVANGATAKMVNSGAFKNDAHRLVGDGDGVRVC